MKAAAVAVALVLATAFGIDGPPDEYGRVVLEARARKAHVPAATFDHWRHRARFTCRLCHVDVGFAMGRGESGITATTNRRGFHCGACHDGKKQFEGRAVFAACSAGGDVGELPACRRCHGNEGQSDGDYAALPWPRGSFREVDWEKAEAEGKVHPLDTFEGVSMPRPPLKMDREVSFAARGTWMKDVRFSHKKHALWNGCEVCHPDIFPSTRAGTVKFNMFEISGGRYCGACHGKVAFALAYCEKCHVNPVGMR